MKTALVIVAALIIGAVVYLNYFMKPEAMPSGGSNAKLNMTAICEGALAYMTFPSGAEAEVWVQECKEGKHPEAVEQWKQMNGITDDRAI